LKHGCSRGREIRERDGKRIIAGGRDGVGDSPEAVHGVPVHDLIFGDEDLPGVVGELDAFLGDVLPRTRVRGSYMITSTGRTWPSQY
jgi:hypothetical protein